MGCFCLAMIVDSVSLIDGFNLMGSPCYIWLIFDPFFACATSFSLDTVLGIVI
jgi:hypothetical protein